MDFVIVNGKVISKKEANLSEFVWDNPFILAQKIWFGFGGIPLLAENLRSIEQQLSTFNLPLPELFRNKRELFRLSKRMLNKNKFYRSGYINYQLFIADKGINTLITSHAFESFSFPYWEKGILVGHSSIKKNISPELGKFQCFNKGIWKSAQMQLRHSECAGIILSNENNFVCEGLASNIFLVKNKTLITPSIETGCYQDILRSIILEKGKEIKMQVLEIPKIEQQHLLEMDEIFFASEAHGINWVMGIENKRYVHSYSEKLHEKLNHYLMIKVEN